MLRLLARLLGKLGISLWRDPGNESPVCATCGHSFDDHYGVDGGVPRPCHYGRCGCKSYSPKT